jgi:dTDP-glucose 4,6-dehydratase
LNVKEEESMADGGRSLDGKSVLVTGGCGFVGSHLIRFLLDRHPALRIVNLDKLTYAGNPANLFDIERDGRYEFVRGDVRDGALVAKIMDRVQVVVHLAAETHVDRSIRDGGEFVLTNVHGTAVLLEALRRAPGVEIFVHLSTDEVYGSRDEGFFKEGDPLSPSSPYAASKAAADHLVRAFHATYGLPVLLLRPSNIFGPNQHPEKFIPLFTTHALEDRPLPLYGDGTNVRDWLYAEDACRAIEVAALHGAVGRVYNVGAGNERTNRAVAERIVRLLGKPRDLIRTVPDRPGHDRRYALDRSKFETLGWAPRTAFEEGLERTVRWYSENREWWREA